MQAFIAGYCEISLIKSVSERRNYFEPGTDEYYNRKANTSSANTIGNDTGRTSRGIECYPAGTIELGERGLVMNTIYEKIHDLLNEKNVPEYRFNQILHSIFKQRIGKYEDMKTLPQSIREMLISEFGSTVYGVRPTLENDLGQVGKMLFELCDGNKVEAVCLRYQRGWESFCISSQCGCCFGCKFCATGTLGLKRNMTAEEITDQLLYFFLSGHNLDSISFMGMGEPLANPNVFEALSILTNPDLFGLSQRRITLSTIGMIPGIRRMTKDYPQVNLAYSLHSPFEDQRNELMPINKKYPLHDVIKVLDSHIQHTGRKVFIAYILLNQINDSMKHAEALANLLQGRDTCSHLYHVDLIPYNYTDKTEQHFTPSSYHQVQRFQKKLRDNGIEVTVRAQFGSRVNAACGQLYVDTEKPH